MKGHGSKLSRQKDEAIAALLEQPTVAAAARAIGVSDQTLGRWMKNPEFDAACRAARQANHRQALARLSRRAVGYVTSIRNIVADPKVRASTRLEAAQFVISEASHARVMEDFAAEVAKVERAAKASRAEAPKLPADEAGRSSRSVGHGAKFPRKKQEAIVHLLETPSVAKAAKACGIGVQTLYQWLKDPIFVAEFRAVECAVFGPASRLMQQRSERRGNGDRESRHRPLHTGSDAPACRHLLLPASEGNRDGRFGSTGGGGRARRRQWGKR
jgi:DNA invertase Pin-like site-specific DNA recombinase